MWRGANTCRPASRVVGVKSIGCNRCPFPFCVVAEANVLKVELKEHQARILRSLGNTSEEIARAIGVSVRSVYRYASCTDSKSSSNKCEQCGLLHSQEVMCKSDVYTVVYKNGQYTIILNRHGDASELELRAVRLFTEYVFPYSSVERNTNGHDYWKLHRVSIEETANFKDMCNAVDSYTLGLRGSIQCPQQLQRIK